MCHAADTKVTDPNSSKSKHGYYRRESLTFRQAPNAIEHRLARLGGAGQSEKGKQRLDNR